MRYGIFDHLDHAGGDLGALYAMRLKLIEAYDEARGTLDFFRSHVM